MVSAWRRLCGLEAYQITEIPRRDEEARAEQDPGRAQRVAALAAAYHAGEPGALGWLRERTGDAVRVLAAGPALVGGTERDEVVLALPGGARGRVLGLGAAAGSMAGLACWRAMGGISDGLAGPPEALSAGEHSRAAPSLEECLLPGWGGPFGWMVVAEPVPSAELVGLADDSARRERLASPMADRVPWEEGEGRRPRERHTELRRGLSTGIWRVHLLAGGTDPAAAARVAGLVCASADLRGLPYSLTPAGAGAGGGANGFRTLLEAAPDVASREAADDLADLYEDVEPRSPFHASTALLAALARTPEREIPGVRLTLRPDFDVPPEVAGPSSPADGLPLGQVLDRQRLAAGPLRIPLDSLNRHVFVCGATGGGKSQTVRGLLEAASRAGGPWLGGGPAQAEYRPAGAGAGVGRIRPGEADAVAAGLNPLEPATDGHGRRFPLQTHADLVRAL